MADFRTERSIGARIQALRKLRGFRSPKELAEAIVGGNLTQATIENIEAGRKASLDISQLLNIAMALRVPITYLLMPAGEPNAKLDLPNLSEDFSRMTTAEFDAWLSSIPDGIYQPTSMEERATSAELQTLRAWTGQRAEVTRLEIALDLERSVAATETQHTRSTADRLTDAKRELDRLGKLLKSAGWSVG